MKLADFPELKALPARQRLKLAEELWDFQYLKDQGVMTIILPHGLILKTRGELVVISQKIQEATRKHNEYLTQLGLPLLPLGDSDG